MLVGQLLLVSISFFVGGTPLKKEINVPSPRKILKRVLSECLLQSF
jgi:hypothetical protein